MSSSPQQQSSGATIDTGPLSWVLGEIREALTHSEQAIDAFSKSDGMDTAQLRTAKTQLHLAHGALRVVDIDGVAVVTEEAEHLYELFENEPLLCNATAVDAIKNAFAAVVEYLQDLMNGQAHQPVRLFPYYRALLAVRSADRIHPADLFFPDLSVRPPVGAAPEHALTADQLARTRARFERGLLQYLRDPQDQGAIQNMHAAVEALEKTQRAGPQRAFWWVTLAFLEGLKAGALPADLNIKRLCARINLQMRRLLDGTATVAERLLKDTLFFVARTGDVSSRITQVKQFYQLQDAIPQDFDDARYGKIDGRVLAQARERLEVAKSAWTRLASGALPDLKAFATEAVALRQIVRALQQPDLERLVSGIAEYGVALQQAGRALPEPLGLEMATALLLTGMVLDHLRSMEEGLSERVDAMLARLKIAASGRTPDENLPWLTELAQEAQQKLFMASVVHEIQVSLASVEKAMDGFFRDPEQKEDLPESIAVLNQVAGALDLLGHADAVAAVRVVQKAAEEFVRADYVPNSTQLDRVAQNCGALGFFAESLQKPAHAVTHTFRFDPATGEFSAHLIEPTARSKPSVSAVEQTNADFYHHQDDVEELTEGDAPPKPLGEIETQPVKSFGLGEQAASASSKLPVLEGDLGLAAAESPIKAQMPGIDSRRFDSARAPDVPHATSQLSDAEIDAELLEIFLGEAEEVLLSIRESLAQCQGYPESQELMTTIRRGFHTLKGSSRMVGLNAFGEAAWGLEQTMNLWLAERRSGTPALFDLLGTALVELTDWVTEIRQSGQSSHTADALTALAKQLREISGLGQEDADVIVAQPIREESAEEALELPSLSGPVAADWQAAQVERTTAERIEEVPPVRDEPAMARFVAQTELPSNEFSPYGLTPSGLALAPESTPTFAPLSIESTAGSTTFSEMPSVVPESEVSQVQSATELPEDVVQIDDLMVSTPLYNIFLSEADDLLRALSLDFSEWRHEPQREVSPVALRTVHSLTGSSATVGLQPVNLLASTLETLLHRMSRNPQPLMDEDYNNLDLAAHALRQMMHRFAAGQMPAPAPELCFLLEVMQERFVAPAVSEVIPTDSSAMADALETPAVLPEIATPPLTSHALPARDEPHAHEDVQMKRAAAAYIQGRQQDEIDTDLLPIFIEEAQDFLPQIAQALRAWKDNPADRNIPQQLLRYTHTIKGSARMAGAMRLGQVIHNMETRIEAAMGLAQVPIGLMEDLQATQDQAQMLFEELLNPSAASIAAAVMAEEGLEQAAGYREDVEIPAVSESAASLVDLSQNVPGRAFDVAQAAAAQQAAPAAAALVRVRSDVLDRLVNQAGEVSIARSRIDTGVSSMRAALSELTENMQRLRSQLREIEIQAEAQMSTRTDSDHLREFDPLEFDRFTRFQEITRMMAESVNDVGTVQQNLIKSLEDAEENLHGQSRLTRELQQDLMRVRMVQFGSISERLYRVVRLASKELDKRVNLDIRGLQVELDRGVLEKMAGPFEHLLRNAVAHGVESRAARRAAGKPEAGELLIEVRQEGNEVVIIFSDDGGGLNISRIRERAESLGLLPAGSDVPEQDIAEIIFEPGFSTATEVTEIAGRGVGMDVVRSEAASLGGRIDLEFTPGAGTRFMIYLPLTLAITQVVLVRVGERQYAFPSVLVEQVQQLKPQVLANAYNERGIVWHNARIEMHYLPTLLGDNAQAPMAQRYSPVVILRAGIHRIAVHVDEIIGNLEAVVKNIGPQLARVPGIAGATVLGTGEIVMILNPVQLALTMAVEARSHMALVGGGNQQAEVMGAVAEILLPNQENTASHAAGTQGTVPVSGLETMPTIMVVDDSLTVRKVTQRLLTREGYQVVLAKDGVDALRQMQDYAPDIMLVDIEMPRMDGFDLTRNIRGDERFKNVPIIMITSRTADKHRNYAMSLGVNVYLGKPYQEAELLQHIRHFLAERGNQATA